MTKPKIDRKLLLEYYLKEVEEICETCEWVSVMTPQMIMGIVSDVLEDRFDEIVKY